MSVREVQEALLGLNVGKAIGPDRIPNRVLKEQFRNKNVNSTP